MTTCMHYTKYESYNMVWDESHTLKGNFRPVYILHDLAQFLMTTPNR